MKLLLITSRERSVKDLLALLSFNRDLTVETATSLAEAKIKLSKKYYDVVLFNSPLADGVGDDFAADLAFDGKNQLIFMTPQASYDAACLRLEKYGVFVIAKPVTENMFWTTIRLAVASRNKLQRLNDDNARLREKIEDIRLVDRAKCRLIESRGMTEEEAHKFIERKAMDGRMTKRDTARQILGE